MTWGGASNSSIRAMIAKSREDLGIIRRYRLGGPFTLIAKNFSKVPQFLLK
jgi:glycosyltransferase